MTKCTCIKENPKCYCGMDSLIEALQIFIKYRNVKNPVHCEHDELIICGISPSDVIKEDIEKLELLGFFVDEEEECFKSYRFGSC